MALTLRTTLRTTLATAIRDDLDSGAGAALIKVYTGTKPAGPDTAITSQVLLGTLTCSDPCGSVSSGVLTFSAITQDAAADATGTATWARITESGGAAIADVSITTSGGGGDLIMNTVTVVTGGPISCSSLTITA